MKTAISIPDETFEQAEQKAGQLGLSRSEFFTQAVQHFLEDLEKGSLIREIDAALEMITPDDSAQLATHIAYKRLSEEDEQW